MSNHALTTPSTLVLLGLFALAWGCGDDDSSIAPDSGVACERADSRFEAFVAGHRGCQQNADCTIIGACGGSNADFRAVTLSAASEGTRLMEARCSGAFDGPMYRAVCTAGACTLMERSDDCCGCQPPSPEAGTDASHDASMSNADSGF